MAFIGFQVDTWYSISRIATISFSSTLPEPSCKVYKYMRGIQKPMLTLAFNGNKQSTFRSQEVSFPVNIRDCSNVQSLLKLANFLPPRILWLGKLARKQVFVELPNGARFLLGLVKLTDFIIQLKLPSQLLLRGAGGLENY